nr:UDP-N-acetylmuramoyl-tripeptide--D-alanyl-D-alanine ligase [Lachnospiraceae bacterium]
MRYNMHMFQLNGYKNGEHVSWIKKNIRMQWVLLFGIILGLVRFFVPFLIADIICYLHLLLIITVYNAMKHMTTKKKLVYTPRVKRMIITNVIVSLLILVVSWCILGSKRIIGCFMLWVGIQFFMNIIVNVINHPIEMAVNNYYIRDAKKMLKRVPGLTIIGVTGSYGKTSVKFYLQTLLQERYHVLVTPESYNTPMGVVRTIRESLKPTHEIFICEMGARHVGDIKEICDIVHPHHGMITSVGPQHLETFFHMDNIKNTKFELADALPDTGMLFLNGDNEYIQEKAVSYTNKTFYYSENEGEGYYAKDISVSQLGTEFVVVTPEGEQECFRTKLIGAHNVINLVGAIAVANRMGIPLKELKIPVRRIQPVEHRMQMREHGLVTIIDDAYNSNPVGSKAAVETLAMFDGIRILITPGMVELGDKQKEYNYKFGTYAADCCDYICLVGKSNSAAIKEGVLSKGFPEQKCMVFDRLEDAVSYAYAIKGQGHKYILLENDLPDNY